MPRVSKDKLIELYLQSPYKSNKNGKIDFCTGLLEYLTEEQIDEEIKRLIKISVDGDAN